MSVKTAHQKYIRATAFLMLLAMFHYVAGYRLIYSIGILFAKQEAKECMVEKNQNERTQNFVSLHLSASDYASLKWTEDNKEFFFNNEMYDVSSIQKWGDSYVITVFVDDKETQWTSSYHDFEKEIYHSDQSSKGAKPAEELSSAFQKEFTPETQLTIYNSQCTIVKMPVVVIRQHSVSLPDNIFHPPSNC